MNLDELVEKNPILEEYYHDGKYDFSSTESQCLIAEAYLKAKFLLSVQLDRTKLCPRIPNRLSYLHWCEHGASSIDNYETRDLVIDIGTGSSAIYPLLGAVSYDNFHFVGTEVDPESIQHARNLVKSNNLEPRITIKDSLDSFRPQFPRTDEKIRYTMCNPPFYEDVTDLYKRSKFKNLKPNELASSNSEMFYPGGEVEFVKHLIDDSIELSKEKPEGVQACWFLSQLGIRASCFAIEELLRHRKKSRKITQYHIEKLETKESTTKRWAVTWSMHWWRWPAERAKYPVAIDVLVTYRSLYSKLGKEIEAINNFNPDLECIIEMGNDSFTVKATIPFWVRKMRRAGLRREKITPTVRCIISVTSTDISWIHGSDYQHFYSFCKLITELNSDHTRLGAT